MFTATDHNHMARAVRLADEARSSARPNPHVGCVLAHGDAVVGEGFTQPAGGDHAEVQALKAAGEQARGATAYVTLEPCCHQGRTPPCSGALVDAGVARVVAAASDPNPRVDGAGFEALRDAGIVVEKGLMDDQVQLQLAGFMLRHRRGRGRLRAKLAMSLDGRTAMASGESQWITGASARRDVQLLRAQSCAVITGVGTVLADDCALTVRPDELPAQVRLAPAARRATRVVVDSHLRTPVGARVLAGEQPSLLAHLEATTPPDGLTAQQLALPGYRGRVDLSALLEALSARECNEILLESGPTLAGAFMQAGLIDELIVYLAPRLLGSAARPLLDLPLERMADVMDLRLVDQLQVGNDLRLTFVTNTNLDT